MVKEVDFLILIFGGAPRNIRRWFHPLLDFATPCYAFQLTSGRITIESPNS